MGSRREDPEGVEVRARRRVPRQDVLAIGLVAAALIDPLARFLGRVDWRADLFSHFPEAALVVTALAFIATAWRHPRVALALALLAVGQVGPLFRHGGANPVAADPRSPARLRVLMANVYCDNEEYALLADLIRRERPDIVGLVEVSPSWIEGLEAVRREYPYRLEAPLGASGVALWFRNPPGVLEGPKRPMPEAWPFLHATFEFAGRTRHLWLIHPCEPLRRGGRRELEALAGEIAAVPGSRIVVGDMNCTEGSSRFAGFLERTGLRDSRLGFGRQGSFPSWSFYKIALDHAFVSDDLAVAGRRLGPRIGSDHDPLLLEIAPSMDLAESKRPSSSR